MQPIIISQGTQSSRVELTEKLITEIFQDIPYSTHVDFELLELPEGKKTIPIELIREIIKQISIKPRISNKKIIWIKEAQSLSVEAQNSLLKTLEEPPSYAQIFITVDHTSNLIPTVLSRCIIKNLSLSNRVDFLSDSYIEIKKDFLDLMSLDIGKKIDWVTNNKERLKSREDVLEMLNNWEVILRERMIESINNSNGDASAFKDNIKLLQKIKKYIQSNANASLAIETLLLNL